MVYRTCPKSDSKLLGKFVGKEHVNGNLCSPDCISISPPKIKEHKGNRIEIEREY